ncbi:ecto-ADP-ribosyltransferase 3 [Gasterosteus aculeatus]
MCDIRKMLLAALLFYFQVNAGTTKLLDMAPDAVDFVYDGCRKEATEKFIHSGLLEQELKNNVPFKHSWGTTCSNQIPGGTKEHTAALSAYADGSESFTNEFDNEVETLGVNVSTYEDRFQFKSLHFLLMDSMFLLRTKKCKPLYFVKEKEYTAQKGSKVRFGKFVKVDSSYSMLRKNDDLEGMVLFNITSCFFVNLGKNICSKDNSMSLISPAEVFTVEAVNEKIDDINESEYTEIVLQHLQLGNADVCSSLSGSRANVASQWIVVTLVALTLLIFSF